MSSLGGRDGDLHYGDNSHRWPCPHEGATPADQATWEAKVRAHLDEHRRVGDGPPQTGGLDADWQSREETRHRQAMARAREVDG